MPGCRAFPFCWLLPGVPELQDADKAVNGFLTWGGKGLMARIRKRSLESKGTLFILSSFISFVGIPLILSWRRILTGLLKPPGQTFLPGIGKHGQSWSLYPQALCPLGLRKGLRASRTEMSLVQGGIRFICFPPALPFLPALLPPSTGSTSSSSWGSFGSGGEGRRGGHVLRQVQ